MFQMQTKHRGKDHPPTHAARWDALRPLVAGLGVPVIANGDLYFPEHVAAVRHAAGDPRLAVMLARPALYNPSVFRALKLEGQSQGQGQGQGLLPLDAVMRDYVKLCVRYENHVSNTKYNLMEMMCRRRHPDHLKVRRRSVWTCMDVELEPTRAP